MSNDLRSYVRQTVRDVLEVNANTKVSSNDVLGDDLGYTSNSVLTLVAQVEQALNSGLRPPGTGPFWLPEGAEVKALVGATVGGFQDWTYHQCKSVVRANVSFAE